VNDEWDPVAERVIDARLAAVLAMDGERLSEEQRAQVRKRIAGSVKQSAALRSVRFDNGDEPEIVFTPYRGVR
jgi:hypothetical protein